MTVGKRLHTLILATALLAAGQSPELARYAADVREADSLLTQDDFAGVIEKLEAWPERLPNRPEASHFLGLAHYRLREFPLAIRHLSTALALERADSAAWRQTVEILGAAYYFDGRWGDAAPLLSKAAGWRPGDSELLYSLAMSYVHLGQRDQARFAFAKVFRVEPDSPQALALTGELMLQENRLSDAETLLREALEQRPDLPGAAHRLGAIAVRQGNYSRALGLLGGALAQNPRNTAAWHALGEALTGLDRQPEAVEALKRAIWLDSRRPGTYLLLAKIYLGLDQLGLAEDTVRRVIEFQPQSYEAHFLRSRIYYKTGQTDLAKRQLAIAERLRSGTGRKDP